MGSCSTQTFRFDGDTLIDGVPYTVLWEVVGPARYYKAAMREDGQGQVFARGFEAEQLLYDFTLEVGDTFTGSDLNGCSPPWWEVAAIDTVLLLDGSERRRWHFVREGLFGEGPAWIEGVGSSWGVAYEDFNWCGADWYHGMLCQSRNDTLLYQDPEYGTCEYSTLSIVPPGGDAGFSWAAAPDGGTLIVQVHGTQGPWSLLVHDIQGRLIQRSAGAGDGTHVLPHGAVCAGVYVLELRSSTGSRAVQRVWLDR